MIFNYMYIISTIYQLILVISINKFLNEKKYYDWDQNEKYISTTSSIGNIFKSRDSNEIHEKVGQCQRRLDRRSLFKNSFLPPFSAIYAKVPEREERIKRKHWIPISISFSSLSPSSSPPQHNYIDIASAVCARKIQILIN